MAATTAAVAAQAGGGGGGAFGGGFKGMMEKMKAKALAKRKVKPHGDEAHIGSESDVEEESADVPVVDDAPVAFKSSPAKIGGVGYNNPDYKQNPPTNYAPFRKSDIGLIAQEVEKVLPDAVSIAPFDVGEKESWITEAKSKKEAVSIIKEMYKEQMKVYLKDCEIRNIKIHND